MEVAVTSNLPGDALDRLKKEHNTRVRDEERHLTAEELADFIGDAEAAITLLADPVDATVLRKCTNLRVVANYAVGYNNIDIKTAEELGIWVTNTPDVLTDATADLTWALILAVVRRVVEADKFMRSGKFRGWRPDLFLGRGLQGKTLGIIGYGRIGQAVAARAVGFGMNIIYYTRSGPKKGTHGEYMELDDLVSKADVLSLHCPLTPETHHLINRKRIFSMKEGAFLINTARGPVVDEAALVEALESGHLGGAGLDVYEKEPEAHPKLAGLDNVVMLPHIGSATVEARSAMAELAVDNVLAVLSGKEPPTPVVRGRV